MEKWLRKDIELSEKLYQELRELDLQKPAVEAQKKELDPEIKQAHKEFVYEAVCNNPPEAFAAKSKVLAGLDKKFAIGNTHYMKRTAIEEKLRKINQLYIIRSVSELTNLVKQLLAQRQFSISEKTIDSSKGLPCYTVLHNWGEISIATQNLMETMDSIRGMTWSPLSEIRKVFEDALTGVKDDYPLRDEVSGGASLIERFREAPLAVTIVPDEFTSITLAQGKALADSNRLKGTIDSLKKFFKRA